MPPSGFTQAAINGLLEFVAACYDRALQDYQCTEGSDERKFLEAQGCLETSVRQYVSVLDSGIEARGVQGLSTFVTENFKDLAKEISTGKKRNGYAIQAELDHIGAYLAQFKI